MRILQVANGYPPAAHGGVETYTQGVAEALAARGQAVEVFCRVSALHEPEFRLRSDAVNSVPVWRVVNDLTNATSFEAHYRQPRVDRLFLQRVEAFRPQVIHFQHCLGLSATLLGAARQLGLPVVVTLHDFWFYCARANLFSADRAVCAGPRGAVDCVRCLGGVRLGPLAWVQRTPLYKWLLYRLPRRARMGVQILLQRQPATQPAADPRLAQAHRRQTEARTAYLLDLLRQADLLLTPSQFVRSAYAAHGLEPERIEVLPLGVEAAAAKPAATPARAPVVAYIGTLHYHKGVDVLVQAYRAAKALPGELRIYGRGDALDTFAEQLHTAAAGDERIRFMGPFHRAELPQVLSEIDLLVIPSRFYETYSLAAREALLSGVPVVASDLGALPEAIREGENGCLTPPGDALALAAALERALARLPALRAGTRAWSPAPTVAEHVSRLLQHYERLAAQAQAQAQPPA